MSAEQIENVVFDYFDRLGIVPSTEQIQAARTLAELGLLPNQRGPGVGAPDARLDASHLDHEKCTRE